MIPLFGGGEVRLDDLGTVTDTIADRRTFARFNGEPVVALGIKRSKGASDVVVAAAVQKRIDALKAAYPDVDLKLIDTSVEYSPPATSAVATPGAKAEKRIASSSGAMPKSGSRMATMRSQ